MMRVGFWRQTLASVLWLGIVAVAGSACGGGGATRLPAAGSMDADKFLYERGLEELAEKHWFTSRVYFRQLIDSYPLSPFRMDAKLGIGDSYLGEGRVDSLILAANEFREFLTFYPVAPRADYAQYKLAIALSRQTLGPQRDQTATHETLREIDVFLKSYPNSPLLPEVRTLHREMRDLLSESEFGPGLHYYRYRWYQGAIERFTDLLRDDPEFTRIDKVYFYLAESLYKLKAWPEAQVYYEKLLADKPDSEHANDAKRRLQEIKKTAGTAKSGI
jgi:outer membrane protein assembly factor BamD